ncbi:MAG TPA: hypothetical protein DCW74_19030 [Alteromonas australica]|uniref:Uncharacterized protein n=1 Tax=Alteromonas australica TaxID=589873 RepID=A0A350P948_9ALTE|nr:hypothetical protein [Alteromonas australica]|tara:strand:- start:250 stop:429 length:180 start_codon:yes stop_codon:yes gene_type:complete
MFNLFRRKLQKDFLVIYRHGTGNWIARTLVKASSAKEACSRFDNNPEFSSFTRLNVVQE